MKNQFKMNNTYEENLISLIIDLDNQKAWYKRERPISIIILNFNNLSFYYSKLNSYWSKWTYIEGTITRDIINNSRYLARSNSIQYLNFNHYLKLNDKIIITANINFPKIEHNIKYVKGKLILGFFYFDKIPYIKSYTTDINIINDTIDEEEIKSSILFLFQLQTTIFFHNCYLNMFQLSALHKIPYLDILPKFERANYKLSDDKFFSTIFSQIDIIQNFIFDSINKDYRYSLSSDIFQYKKALRMKELMNGELNTYDPDIILKLSL